MSQVDTYKATTDSCIQVHVHICMTMVIYDLLTLTNVTVSTRPSLVTPANKRTIAIGTCAVYTGYRV